MKFSSLDKPQKIKIIVAGAGLLVGAGLIVNAATDGAIKETIAPTEKPAPPPIETKQAEEYKRQMRQIEQTEQAGTSYSAGG
ncbi:MAG: hypothetical protein KF787_02660 [Phycisphaeraceae bacterium]|nr:hypothetical protein [Phycisphaerae bacterium]MBX3391528.1 hypothetical protein [Phycisphaeraceae bacterium]